MSDRPARGLFEVAPSAYVEERTRLAKQARADGDKELAKAIQALKRPTLAVWALVAAGADPALVRSLYAATSTLGEAQASGDRQATMAATKERKDTVGAVTSAAVDALRAHEPSAEARRPEIRTLVDQLSRHPELADAWIDGTLRELPDEDAFGFAAFAGLEVVAATPGRRQESRPEAEAPPRRERTLKSVPDAPKDERPARDPERERAERAARAARAAERRDAMRARERAASVLAAAERKLAGAEAQFRDAEADLAAARAERDAAAERHARSVGQVDRLAEE